jgi:hypothetical protein
LLKKVDVPKELVKLVLQEVVKNGWLAFLMEKADISEFIGVKPEYQ